ncbi:MAG TPA: hypothetical protein PK156_37735 [Polyangium sp.]|nr:hypothetical protein [Polyangium sp.]
MNSWRTARGKACLALLALTVPWLGLACEPEVKLRDPLCAKHPPPRDPFAIDLRMSGPFYYDSAARRCTQYCGIAPADLEASDYETWEAYFEAYVPFKSFEECVAVCHEPQPCDPDNPCPPFEYPCALSPCSTAPQTCVWVSSEGRGYCALQCQEPGTVEHMGWSIDAMCPDPFTCSAVAPGDCYPCREYAEACVLPER